MRSPAGGTFTFEVGAGGATDRGAGDLHDRRSDAFGSGFAVEVGGRSFQFRAYPSQALVASFLTNGPRNVSAVVTLLAGAIVFLLHEFAHRRVSHQIETAAAVESAKAEVERDATAARHVFMSSVSHEIRSPASAIIGVSGKLASRLRAPVGAGCPSPLAPTNA